MHLVAVALTKSKAGKHPWRCPVFFRNIFTKVFLFSVGASPLPKPLPASALMRLSSSPSALTTHEKWEVHPRHPLNPPPSPFLRPHHAAGRQYLSSRRLEYPPVVFLPPSCCSIGSQRDLSKPKSDHLTPCQEPFDASPFLLS